MIIRKVGTFVKLDCIHCFSGRIIIDRGEYVCNGCGHVYDISEIENIEKIINAMSDKPPKPIVRKNPPKPKYIQYKYGNTTKTYPREEEEKKEEQIIKALDHNMLLQRATQHARIEIAIDNICTELGLNPDPVLNKFENRFRKVKANEIFTTNNIVANKGHLRGANVVAAAFIWKVYRNNTTFSCWLWKSAIATLC